LNKKISIVIPVYSNSGSLPDLFKELILLEKKLKKIKLNMELIFVDDGSPDDSYKILKQFKKTRPNSKLIKLTRNFGAIHASKCGFKFVTGNCFTLLAADLQDPPVLIFEMAKKWLAGSKFVIYERVTRDDPLTSKFFASIYYKLLHKLVISDYPKNGYDLGLMDEFFLPYLVNSSKTLHTPILAYWLGFKPEVLYYHRRERIHGLSGWTFTKKVKAFFNIMFGFSTKPIRVISFFGLSVSTLSFFYGSFVVINAFLGNIPIPGYASIISLVSFLLSLILLMLVIISEYIWHISDELNKRPEYVIEEMS